MGGEERVVMDVWSRKGDHLTRAVLLGDARKKKWG